MISPMERRFDLAGHHAVGSHELRLFKGSSSASGRTFPLVVRLGRLGANEIVGSGCRDCCQRQQGVNKFFRL